MDARGVAQRLPGGTSDEVDRDTGPRAINGAGAAEVDVGGVAVTLVAGVEV